MPIYVYEVITDDGDEGQIFEVEQKMSDPPLTQHPTTGQPVRRIIQPPNLPSRWTERQARHNLSNKNLERLGFSKYENTGDGFRKIVGKEGPKKLGGGGE